MMMKSFLWMFLLLGVFSVSGCVQQKEHKNAKQAHEVVLSCVAVLPTQTTVDYENTLSKEDGAALQTGRSALDTLLREYLTDRGDFRFVSGDNAVMLPITGSGDLTLEGARQAAASLGCNAVLETTMLRYKERIGAEYGVREPAAATFAYRLFEVGEGKVLCHGRFDEKQEAVMDNLLNIDKLRHRKLAWLTAEELTRAGVQETLSTCAYIE